ncbi:uncharacterized protein EpC_14680 [Erwinia pyrifoliae Ep1/96]|nr:uncharacterized protein EpC_14680 [Erwinia pyrifoliae Ep1/96]
MNPHWIEAGINSSAHKPSDINAYSILFSKLCFLHIDRSEIAGYAIAHSYAKKTKKTIYAVISNAVIITPDFASG